MKSLTEYLWFEVPQRRGFLNITGAVEDLVGQRTAVRVAARGVHEAEQRDLARREVAERLAAPVEIQHRAVRRPHDRVERIAAGRRRHEIHVRRRRAVGLVGADGEDRDGAGEHRGGGEGRRDPPPPGDARLIGLFQSARVVLLPSVSETFGLVVLEAWAAGAPVIASRTSGASTLIRESCNGWLFDHGDSRAFQKAIDAALLIPGIAAQFAAEGGKLVNTEYNDTVLAGRLKNLYAQLIEEKHGLRHSKGR